MQLAHWIRQQPDFADPSSSQSTLPALYSDLATHRISNRSSFDASVAWWKDVLSRASLAGAAVATGTAAPASSSKGKEKQLQLCDRLVLHVDQALLDALTLEEVGRPLGLGTVVMELRSDYSLINLVTFLTSSSPIHGPAPSHGTVTSRALAFAMSPLVWAMSQLSLKVGVGQRDSSEASETDWRKAKGDWVIWSNVNALAEAIIERHRAALRLSQLDCLFSRRSFHTSLIEPALADLCASATEGDAVSAKPRLTERDFAVLLKYLTRDCGFALLQGDVIKVEKEHDENMREATISEHERGIVNVRDTHAKLEEQIGEVERRIKERQAKVEECLKRGSRTQAVSYLRSKKALEVLLNKRVAALETLHGILLKIEQAASDVEIMKAYETSTKSLKALLSDVHLQPERIDASMDVMQEALADAEEVRRAVDVGQDGLRRAAGAYDDTEEFEAELAAMQREAERVHANTAPAQINDGDRRTTSQAQLELSVSATATGEQVRRAEPEDSNNDVEGLQRRPEAELAT